MVIVGRLKIPFNDLFYYSISDFKHLVKGHEADIKDEWERERIAAYINITPHLKKNANLTPQKIWALPWDQIQAHQKIDIKDLKENLAKFKAAIVNRKNGKS